MILKGKLVSLRPMEPKEVKLIHKWANTPYIIPLWYGKRMSLKQVKDDWKPQYFSDRDPYSGRCFAILAEGEPIGMIAYNVIDRKNKSVELDMIIGDRKHWGKGYGPDALKTLTGYLFRRFRLNRIWLDTYANNPRAVRAYQKAGFRKEGLMRENVLLGSRFIDSVKFSVLRKEFKE